MIVLLFPATNKHSLDHLSFARNVVPTTRALI